MHSSVVFAHSHPVKPSWLFIPITFHLPRLELLTVHTRSCLICLISWDPLVCLLSTWTRPFRELRETVVGVHVLESSCFYLCGIFGTHSCQSVFATVWWVFKSVGRCLWVFPFCFPFLIIILRPCNMLCCFVSFATWSMLTLNSWSSQFSLLSAGVTGLHHQVSWLSMFLFIVWKPELYHNQNCNNWLYVLICSIFILGLFKIFILNWPEIIFKTKPIAAFSWWVPGKSLQTVSSVYSDDISQGFIHKYWFSNICWVSY